jgi:hypothetical protein
MYTGNMNSDLHFWDSTMCKIPKEHRSHIAAEAWNPKYKLLGEVK